jgi:hypothetical protein
MPTGVYPRSHKPKPLCIADGCTREREIRNTGMCFMHHRRFMRHGNTDLLWPRHGEHCSINRCLKPIAGRGMCSAHYTNWLRYKDPLHQRTMKPETREKISKTTKGRVVSPEKLVHSPLQICRRRTNIHWL